MQKKYRQERLEALAAEIADLRGEAESKAAGRSARLAEAFARVRGQLFGPREQRRAFFAWWKGSATHDPRFTPLGDIPARLALLEKEVVRLAGGTPAVEGATAFGPEDGDAGSTSQNGGSPPPLPALLVLGTNNFDFLTQRPQHLARLAAANGHRVVYIDAEMAGDMPWEVHHEAGLRAVRLAAAECGRVVLHDIYGEETADKTRFLRWQVVDVLEAYGLDIADGCASNTAKKADNNGLDGWPRGKPDATLEEKGNPVDCTSGRCSAAIIIKVEHPLWCDVAQALREEYGWPIVFDYMDDYTGFSLDVRPDIVSASARLVEEADWVIATSSYLYDKVQPTARAASILRNGTGAAHFASAVQPDWTSSEKNTAPNCQGKNTHNTLPVIGYYGVVSDWFDWRMIEALENSGLDICIRLVGSASEAAKAKAASLAKVELLDAVPYDTLPAVLQAFDVCIIPFEADSELIQATNPVKFYEYLAGGKKVVATRIPELEAFEGRFALLVDTPAGFVVAVAACLDGTDGLAPQADRIAFAVENDWTVRAQGYEEIFVKLASVKTPAGK